MLLLYGLRYWPGIALGAFLLNWTAGVPFEGAAGIAVGNTLEAVTAAWLLHRVAGFRPALERLRDVLVFVTLAALASTTLSATLGVTSLWASGVVDRSAVGSLWLVWWSGDALGDLLVAPLLLTWAHAGWPRGRWPEAGALVVALVLLTTLLLRNPLTYVYAVFPVVVWAAVRLGPRGAATATALIASLTIWHTLRGLGPFVGSTPTGNLALLQTFITLFSVTGLVLAAVTSERSAAEQAAHEGEERFRLLVDSVQDYAIIRLDPAGRVVSWSVGAERIKGYPAQEILGREFSCFYTPEDATAGKPAANLREAAERGRCEIQGWRVRKDGSHFWADAVLTAIRDRDGALVGFAKVTRDLTERKQAQESLARTNAELEGFSYSVSHDLRSPLRAIDGYARVLLEDYAAALDAEGQRLLNAVRDNAKRMGQLIDSLLRFSRLGRQALKLQPIDMTGLARAALEDLRQVPGDGHPEVSLQDLPPAVGDRTLLQQVLANLLSNAFKFSRTRPRPRVEIAARLEGTEAVYFVRDNGVGFDMAYADKLFQVFNRLHGTNEFEGTGVGLALVQRIVERHGGRVWAEGAVNEGATFYFTLPRQRGVV